MQAGLWAPVLLVLCRVLQGFAVGGEFTATMVGACCRFPNEAGTQASQAATLNATHKTANQRHQNGLIIQRASCICLHSLAWQVFLVEHAPPHRAGLLGSAAFASVMVGVLVGSGVAMLFNFALSGGLTGTPCSAN